MGLIHGGTGFVCPKCGNIINENIKIYNENLRKQNFSISPILPTCLLCGSEITLKNGEVNNCDSKVIVLTGTSASGKSATAEILMHKYEFEVIDGDCVMQVVKYKLGNNKIKYNEPQVYEEIEMEIDILLGLQKNIVISHVITPQDIDIYRKMLRYRKLNYKIFLLQPRYTAAIARSKTRTCHKSITTEEWVKHFYEELNIFEKHIYEDIIIFDNSDYSLEESVDKIMEIYGTA